MGETMSFSNRGVNPALKRVYNKWRMASLGLNLGGLVAFLFSLDLVDITKPLMILSLIMLWAAVVVSYKYVKVEEGRTFEPVAKISYTISMFLALVLSVLVAITFMHS